MLITKRGVCSSLDRDAESSVQVTMSIYSTWRRSRRASRSQLGHLKLAAFEDANALVVQIFEARGLMRKENAPLDVYVKLYLLPDPRKETKEKTVTVKQKDPVFNSKFSFLNDEFHYSDKSLFISVWTHRSITSRNEMIGCMTFKVAELLGPNKGLNGWYQFLDASKGRNENVQVASKFTSPNNRPKEQQFAVTLLRSERGYGFNVDGHNPVYVAYIIEGLPAHQADIRVGDVIVEIEGTDVVRADRNLVISMVKKCPEMLHLILRRDPNAQYTAQTLGRRKKGRRHSSGLAPSSRSQSIASFPLSQPETTPLSHYSLQNLMPVYHQYSGARRHSDQPMLNVLSQPNVSSYEMENGGIHPLPTFKDRSNHSRSNSKDLIPEESGMEEDLQNQSNLSQSRGGNLSQTHGTGGGGGGSQSSRRSRRQNSLSQHSLHRESSEELLQPTAIEVIGPTANTSSGSRFVLTQPLNEDDGGIYRGGNVGGSMRHPPPAPRHYTSTNMVYYGAATQHHYDTGVGGDHVDGGHFMRSASLSPRHMVPPPGVYYRPGQHSTNQKLADMGMGHEEPPTDGEDVPVDWEGLGTLEQKRQRAMNNLMTAEFTFCEDLKTGIEIFLEPLRQILERESHEKIFFGLEELYEISREFCSQIGQRRLPLTGKPVPFYLNKVADIYWDKIKLLMKCIEVYLRNYTTAYQEIALSYTIEGFNQHMQRIDDKKLNIYVFLKAGKEYLPRLLRSMMALTYFTPLSHDDQKYLYDIVEALVKVCQDKELVQTWEKDQKKMSSLQVCVGFGSSVKPFPVEVPGRVLLEEGEVTLVEKRRRRKLWMLMFSDMVLLTRRQGKLLIATEEPFPLETLMVQDLNCNEATEFQLSTADGSLNRLVRAPSIARKETWMQTLKERATGSLTNRRKISDKPRGPPLRFQGALRRQQLQLAATLASNQEEGDATTLSEMTAIPEKGASRDMKNEGTKGAKDGGIGSGGGGDLKRGSSKRRTLFNVGAKKDSDKSKQKRKGSKGHADDVQKKPSLDAVSVELLQEWETSFNALLKSSDGVELFEEFLRSEFSDENIQFWKACERFKTVPEDTLEKEAEAIFEEYLSEQSPKLVNLDHQTIKDIMDNMKKPDKAIFSKAQHSIYLLMARDPFVRFVKSPPFQNALKR